jgi:hypothetical protein
VCSYVGISYADVSVHMNKIHQIRVNIKSCIPEVAEMDTAMITQLQRQEPEFRIIYNTHLGTDDYLPDTATTKEKRFMLAHEFIESENGLLYVIDVPSLRTKSRVRTQLRLCIPKLLRKKILTQVHGGILSSHAGIIHTYDKLRENVWWPSMLKDVSKYVNECSVCKVNKGKQSSMPVQPMMVPNGPFEMICVDIIGPLPTTEKGNKYSLVAVDRFTRLADAWPIADQSTKTVTLAFIEGWVCKHGIPLCVTTDRGSPFVSQLAADLYKELGIKRIKTTAYHPQSNGLVERFNKTLKQTLKIWSNDNQDDWDVLLCYAVFSYNTLFHTLLQETPFFVAYGRDAVLHIDIMNNVRREKHAGVHEYATEVVQKLYDVHTRVKDILKNENEQRIEKMVELREFKIGEKVLLHDVTTKVGLSRKFTKRWKGPYTIIERNSDVTYTIEKDGKIQLVSLHRLRLAGEEINKNYLEHEEDLVFADIELASINDTIQHLLTLQATKENEKLLLINAVAHDKSVVDNDGKVIEKITIVEEVVDDDNDLQSSLGSSSSNQQHVNTLIINDNTQMSYLFSSLQMRHLW